MAYRFSGHETFPCRYGWLPKAFAEIQRAPDALADDEAAMVALGVGKNMVRAIRFWLGVTGVATAAKHGRFEPTELGRQLFDSDPFLEDSRTLWLLHWQIASHASDPLFAWDFLFNRWSHHEFTRASVLAAFERESKSLARPLSPVTLHQHFDVFLHTYLPTRGKKGDVQEDSLDCPLVELGLIIKAGERAGQVKGQRETVYAFRAEDDAGVTDELFTYCLDDYWRRRWSKEKTLPFRDVAVAPGSPGRLFKLPEANVRERVERLAHYSGGRFSYRESSAQQHVVRLRRDEHLPSLNFVLQMEGAHV